MKVVRAFWTLSDNMETYQYSVPDAFLHYFHTSQRGGHHRFIYSLLDAVPPIHAESSHVATDKVPSM